MRQPAILLVLTLAVSAAAWAAAEAANERSGAFEGQSRHQASGTVSVVMTDQGAELVLGADFSFDGAPDPKLAFGRDGYVPETLFSPLRENSGSQRYAIPDRIDPSDYNEVWIWCERFDVALAVARLDP